jgi:predicted aspartyl protease
MRNDLWLIILLALSVTACVPQQPLATPAKKPQQSRSTAANPTPVSVIANPVATAVATDTFSIPIQQKLGGVPIIEVTLVTGNQSYKVPMLFDTGASHTMITQATADRLKIKGGGGAQATTANGVATFKRAPIESIKFGNGEAKQVQIAIAQGGGLSYGLLGHDVYDGYDITIKLNSIEFHKR